MDTVKHPAAAPPSSRPTSDIPMTTSTATVEPPSPAAAVKPDPKLGSDNLIMNCVAAVVHMFGGFVIMAFKQSGANVAVAAVMFIYSAAVCLLVLGYWDKQQNHELAEGSGYRIVVWLSSVTGMMFISLTLIALLLRPDWWYLVFVVVLFMCATAIVLWILREMDRIAHNMRSRASSHQEKTSDQV